MHPMIFWMVLADLLHEFETGWKKYFTLDEYADAMCNWYGEMIP